MTTIHAEIIADSVSEDGHRITTFQLRYPRYIHAELLTHRLFSRNASSSRAIPVKRLIEDVQRDPVYPVRWGKNQPGMQAETDLKGNERNEAFDAWRTALDSALKQAHRMREAGAHKQLVNRILEPFAHINVVLTATEFQNFFYLRDSDEAQPEIRRLAHQMRVAMIENQPNELSFADWHAPYISEEDDVHDPSEALKVSAARCARVSYRTHDGEKPTREQDLDLFERLYNEGHASPFEHQARPHTDAPPELSGNLEHYEQFRKILEP